MNNTQATALHLQIEILKQQIELEESNYKYAVELGKDYDTLLLLREQINEHKQHLYSMIETSLDVENKLNE